MVHARIALAGVRFRSGHKSFCRFDIRSCLATSHEEIIKTPLSMTSSCILEFQATGPLTRAHFYSSSDYCTLANRLANPLANRKVFLRQITAGCKHSSARLDKWLEILVVEDLTPKERRPELQGEQRRSRPVRSSSGLYA